jgi:hypothetical protein
MDGLIVWIWIYDVDLGRHCGKLFCDAHTMYQMKLSMSAQWEPVRYRSFRATFTEIGEHGVGYAKRAIRREMDIMIPKVYCRLYVANVQGPPEIIPHLLSKLARK